MKEHLLELGCMKGGRSTVGMVAAVLVQMWKDIRRKSLPLTPGILPITTRERRGEFAAIMGLVRIFNQGTHPFLKGMYCNSPVGFLQVSF